MAGSRTQWVGTIFTRMTGLLRSGAVKLDDKPLWYDVYKAFPPTYEPRDNRPVQKREIPSILYAEDAIRAKFYKEFPNSIMNLSSEGASLAERFVKKHQEIQKEGDAADVFAATVEAFGLVPQLQQRPPFVSQIPEKGAPAIVEADDVKIDFSVGKLFPGPKVEKQ